ncbi:MAG: DivIVA domain-containing protein [Clostridia bacterium]|nr:DivIVA domain-containing protein [Clostridia bacterium]
MLSANDVKNVTFSKQVNGYRREEVDVFLDKVESDYENYERTVRELSARVHELETRIDDTRNSEDSIQSVLLSAQKLADSIVEDAKVKSAEIIEEAKSNLEVIKAREKEMNDSFEKESAERKSAASAELEKIIDDAKISRDKVSAAVEKTVLKQSQLYNRLKLETAAFKAEIMDKYKRHLELISKIPDTIPTDPEEIAAAVDLNVDDLSDKERFIASIEDKVSAQKEAEDILGEILKSEPEEEAPATEPVTEEEKTEEPEVRPQEEKPKKAAEQTGFVVNLFDQDNDE